MSSAPSSSGWGITSLYVTHDQSEAMAISDKVVIMKDGVICQQGTPQEIYEQPASRFVANFIGKANFIDGIFKGRDGEAALVEIGGKTFSIPAPGKMEGVEVGGACCLTVRPESLHCLPRMPVLSPVPFPVPPITAPRSSTRSCWASSPSSWRSTTPS